MTPDPAPSQPAWHSLSRRYWGLLVVLLAILLIAAVRVRLRDTPLERDEGEYAYAGQLILEGIPPYGLAYNMKFPGTYAGYALIMAVFGQTPAGIHLGVLCVTSLTALLVYWLGRKLVDEWTGAAAGAFCVFLSASPSMFGLAGHATHFAGLFATAGLCLLWPGGQRNRPAFVLTGGAMFGLAVLMKQQAAPIVLWGLGVLAFGSPTAAKTPARAKIRRLAVFSLGVVLPFLGTCLILWGAGVFEKFWFWTIHYARAYVSIVSLEAARELFRLGTAEVVTREWVLWVFAAIGLVSLWWGRRKPVFRYELAGLFLVSFLTTCPGFYFRVHYFLLMVPALALLAACGLRALRQIPKINTTLANAVMLLAGLLALSWNVFENRDYWFDLSPPAYSRSIYGANPFIESEPVSEFIRTNSAPTDTVAVLGSEPQIYFLSHRHSASSYIYMYPLMEDQPFAHEMQLEMIRQLEAARPKFVVLVSANYSWLQSARSDPTVTTWWPASFESNYILVGVADIISMSESRLVWGRNLSSYQPVGDSLLLTYQRKDNVVPPTP